MKIILLSLILISCSSSYGQSYSFSKSFKPGTVVFRDSSEKQGLIKWAPGTRVKFRQEGDAHTKRFKPKDILGFTADTAAFTTLSEFRGYSNDFPIWGRTTKVKHVFGQLLETGSYDTYLVYLMYRNPHTHRQYIYPNIVFAKRQNGDMVYVAYPYHLHVSNKKLEKAKKHLYEFFDGNEAMIEKIKAYNKRDDFLSVVSGN